MTNFNGYDLFHHVRNPALRTWNRFNTYLNIVERHGKVVGQNYLKSFNRKAQEHLFALSVKIDNVGYEQYRRDLMRGVNA